MGFNECDGGPVFVTDFIAYCTYVQVQSRVTIMSPSPHDSLSIVPSTVTTSASSPHPTPNVEHVSDMSDLDDSEPEDDLSPILNALIVSSIKSTLVSTTNSMIFVSLQTIPIPQNSAEAKELMRQARSKRKSAAHKSEIALMEARLYRSRAQHAKHVLNAANAYMSHVRWTIRRSKHTSVLSKRVDRATAVTDPVVRGMQGTQLFLWNQHD